MSTQKIKNNFGITGFTVQTDRELLNADGHSRRYLRIEVKADTAEATHVRPPVQVAFALDRSGSMSDGKLEMAAQAVRQAVALLHAQDRFSVVFFDDEVDVVVPVTLATAEAKARADALCAAVQTGGSTNLEGGWIHACHQLADGLNAEAVGLVMLLTDGQANVGQRDPLLLAQQAQALRKRGIATTCIGLGSDFNEALLRGMALAADGRFHFVEHVSQLPQLMREELSEALEVVARDVAVLVRPHGRGRLEALPGVRSAWCAADLFGFAHLRMDLGDLASAQSVVFGVAVDCPSGEDGETLTLDVQVIVGKDSQSLPIQSVQWTFAPPELLDRQPRNRVVDRMVAGIYAAEARMQAVGLNRERHFTRAEAVLCKARERIASYAGNDAELLKIVRELEPDIQVMAAPMMEMDRKTSYTKASHVQRSRKEDGKRQLKDELN